MALIAIPAKFGFTTIEDFTLTRAASRARSRYTGVSQKVLFPYAVWVFKATLVEYDGQDAANIRAFLMALEGIKNTFRLPVPGYLYPSNNPTLTGVADATAVRAVTMRVVTNITGPRIALKAGEYFTINDELKVVTADCNLGGDNAVAINFQPPLRAAVAATTAVTFINPTILLEAVDEDSASWSIKPPYRHSIKINAIEAL